MEPKKINSLKKWIAAWLLALVVFSSAAAPVFAKEGAAEHITLTVGVDEMRVDDETVAIEDAVPVLNGNRVYVPLRAVAEAFGAEVNYDGASGDVTIETADAEVIMNTLASVYSVNGTLKWMDMAPYVNSEGRTMVPVRFVSDGLGYELDTAADENGATVVHISRSQG